MVTQRRIFAIDMMMCVSGFHSDNSWMIDFVSVIFVPLMFVSSRSNFLTAKHSKLNVMLGPPNWQRGSDVPRLLQTTFVWDWTVIVNVSPLSHPVYNTCFN